VLNLRSFFVYFAHLRRKIENIVDSGDVIKKTSVYAEHRQWCITFDLRVRRDTAKIGTMTISISDTVYTYKFSENEISMMLEAINSTWRNATP